MKSFFEIKILLLIISFTCVNVNPESVSETINLNIGQVNSIAITNQLTESFVGQNGFSGVPFFHILVNNNDFDGYNITISSSNSGQLRINSGYNESKNGTFITYSNVWEPNDAGTFFKYDCTSGTPISTSVDSNSTVYVSDTLITSIDQSYFSLNNDLQIQVKNPFEASVNCKAYVLLIANADTTVFSGTFSDTISVSISNR